MRETLIVATILALAALVRAQTAPAQPPPATQPADFSTPQGTMRAILSAMASHNIDDLRACLWADSDDQRPFVDAIARMLIAGRRMADAATARFGPAADGIGKGPIVPADSADIAQAGVTISPDGDSAELLMPGHTMPLRFVRKDGRWLLKAVDFAGSQPRDLSEQAKLTDMFAAAMLEAATEIEEDRHGTAEDAEAAIRQKLNFVLMRSLNPATRPATRP